MKEIYRGKTKDVFQMENGNYCLFFKDDVTSRNGVFDPGANHVGLKMKGSGMAALKLTNFFYEKLNSMGIPTHFVSSDLQKAYMEVFPATPFGCGVEVICRFKAVGSFLRRYGKYVKEGDDLPSFVEMTLKDDDREDPPISKEALSVLTIMNEENYEKIVELTRKISSIIKDELAKKSIILYDIKLEFGHLKDGRLALIDEISGGNMRAYKDGKQLSPIDIAQIVLSY